jgi:methionine biosynthesis protein MetW
MTALRPDLAAIATMVPANARVLDIGCGNGDLLAYLRDEKSVDGRGIELDAASVNAALARGLSVIQGDADKDLGGYPAGAFDLAILSQTLQAMHRPRDVLNDLLRVAGATIVSFPNFGHWRIRAALTLTGRMPVTRNLPNHWYDTPNIHLCTVADFCALCEELTANVTEAMAVSRDGAARAFRPGSRLANLTAETAIFKLSK